MAITGKLSTILNAHKKPWNCILGGHIRSSSYLSPVLMPRFYVHFLMYRFLIHYENVPVWEQINSCTIYEKQSFQHGRTFRHLKLAWSKLFQLTMASSKNYQYKDSFQRH
jgi:hypothetical protein